MRHPWETARAVAIERVLREANARPKAVLDFGCGDGFTGERVRAAFAAEQLLGFDIHLSDEQCKAQSNGQVTYTNAWAQVESSAFDLCLLCDVIEHVEDDRAVLELVRERLVENGLALVTVPAFQALFTTHDRALRHFRRYRLKQLERVIVAAGFELQGSGYMFASLLPGRGLTKLAEALTPTPEFVEFGIGAWSAPRGVSRALEALLNLDNSMLLGLAARGIKLPGLSAWALCQKRPS